MTKATNKKFAGLRSIFPGDSVFTIVTNELDQNFDQKPEELKIAKAAVHASIKNLLVNEIKAIKLSGDLDGLLINGGGPNGLTYGANDSFVNEVAEVGTEMFSEPGTTKKWFGSYAPVKEICNAINESEIMRLKAISADIKKQIEALEAINQANEDAAQRYE